jgi:hypothetical protein
MCVLEETFSSYLSLPAARLHCVRAIRDTFHLIAPSLYSLGYLGNFVLLRLYETF